MYLKIRKEVLQPTESGFDHRQLEGKFLEAPSTVDPADAAIFVAGRNGAYDISCAVIFDVIRPEEKDENGNITKEDNMLLIC